MMNSPTARTESPRSRTSESELSGRARTPSEKQETPSFQPPKLPSCSSSNPIPKPSSGVLAHSITNLVSSSPRSSAESVSVLAKSPECASSSAFSNPTLHSAAVHHRNLQAAAAAAQQLHQLNSLALTGLNFNPLAAQGAGTAHSQLAIHNLLPHFPLLNNA